MTKKNFNFDDEENESESADRDRLVEELTFNDYEQYELMQTDINQKLLGEAVGIAKDTWFWSFMSLEYKMERIHSIYDKLSELVKNGGDDAN